MMNPTWFGLLAIPVAICWKIGSDWRKANSLLASIPEEDAFDKFKKSVLEANKSWASFFFLENVGFGLMLGGLLIFCAGGAIPESTLSFPVGILTLSSFIFLIGDIIFVRNDIMEDLKDKALIGVIKNKSTFEDLQQILITSYKLKDKSLKDDFDEYLIRLIKKNFKKKKKEIYFSWSK